MFLGFYNYTVYLTYLNTSIGLLGMFFLVNGEFNTNSIKFASICILLSGIFDMFDGKVSNFKKKRSIQEKKYGIQIDSLADIISFGILPIFIGYGLFHNTELPNNPFLYLFIFISICYILTVLIRLAYFNVLAEENYDDKKSKENLNVFLGVPVTLSSIIFPCLILFQNIMMKKGTDVNNIKNIFFTIYLFIMCLLSFLFIFAKIKFPKIKNIIFLIFSCLLSFLIIYYLL
ncbi:CDP-diacylglycerol--serine O-phosphatidyltransferase [Candidatus Phytoplasma rubi]|uniref:CDP-diacylglycerol--serine O-phosphatidyltransferase n=1 Tax=Candidatus Phytoplasma rubi TaxID=399025 RepID=A0ABY7BYG4_9MOLU|nr:CDP-alcohol phosphatidyltransferase family protein [Candidatus Phytoplasma rubi]WAN63666.1 CDP-diacylglycerol--serine O-phosphatidyltransferase [Candidatus Phytoplasma rubi]